MENKFNEKYWKNNRKLTFDMTDMLGESQNENEDEDAEVDQQKSKQKEQLKETTPYQSHKSLKL